MVTRRLINRFALTALLVLLALVRPAAFTAVGTCTVVSTASSNSARYIVTCVTDASGATSANPFSMRTEGRLIQAKVQPGSGAAQPSDLFDLTIVDAAATDLLDGQGANLSNATGEYLLGDPPVFVDYRSTLDIVLANGGNAKTVVVTLWVR